MLLVMPFVCTLQAVDIKDKKFQMRLKEHEREALHKVAERKGVSAANYFLCHLRKDAKKMGISMDEK